MLRNARSLVVAAAVTALAGAGCGGDGGGQDAAGVRFAVYDAEEQLGSETEDGPLRCGPPRALCPPNILEPSGTYHYEPTGEPALDESAAVSATVESAGAEPVVAVELTAEGADAFAALTRRLAETGREAGRQRHAAVVVDDEIVALAAIDYEQYPTGIETTGIQFFAAGREDAERIARVINGEDAG